MNGAEAFPGMRSNPVLWIQPNNFSTANSTHYCKDSGMPPALPVYIFFILHGIPITWHLQGTTATANYRQPPGCLSHLSNPAAPGGTDPAGCPKPACPAAAPLTPQPEIPRGGQWGDYPGRAPSGLTTSSARRAGLAGHGTARLAPHLASESRRRAGALRVGRGAWRATLLPTPSQVPPQPSAPRLYGLRAGPRCQSAAPGRAPDSPLRGGDTNLAAPSPPRLPAGPSPPGPAPGGRWRGGAAAGQDGSGRPRGGSGAEGQAGEPPAAWRGRERRSPREAAPGPAAGRQRGRDPPSGQPSPVPAGGMLVLGPSGRPGSPGGTCRLSARCSCRHRGKIRPSRGLIFILFIF